MTQLLMVAKHLNELYVGRHGDNMDEMKMHKMMYLTQRESLIVSGEPLFDGEFEAWKYGPVLTAVRSEYMTGNMFSEVQGELDENEARLVNSVFERYDKYDSWQLSTLSHAESSWLKARGELKMGEPCKNKMSLSAMRVDATKEKLRRKGVVLA
ncbi:MAG: DUF4065 domain-containing protein [Lachnospiraceae bacterium]|nr:DUF4065 domain-containing protein [Lachnospiraceae bacterium]